MVQLLFNNHNAIMIESAVATRVDINYAVEHAFNLPRRRSMNIYITFVLLPRHFQRGIVLGRTFPFRLSLFLFLNVVRCRQSRGEAVPWKRIALAAVAPSAPASRAINPPLYRARVDQECRCISVCTLERRTHVRAARIQRPWSAPRGWRMQWGLNRCAIQDDIWINCACA